MIDQTSPFSENVRQPALGVIFIIFLVGAMVGFQLGRWSNNYERSSKITPTGIACSLDAKLCPDGSGVGRIPPNCEFAPCPENISLPPLPDATDPAKGGCTIGGCSGELCYDSAEGEKMSPCVYKEEYSCLPLSSCERKSSGECGWTQTPEYLRCLNSVDKNL
ncbi:hypothetical protein A2774_01185 [Candidatus Roizmanbacteria bacterium RIFCSPHIGHO2_01_FULL_39_12c]|uniref:Kazal-like domain-containing protein n=1 Tax=Candidatus Roizmanbacteria bacterium RIFCSPHIGHO2_01_FULL_39_12c TaxID=1802031 RepID=A0A1F7G7Y6_9BACT|nr:MAG: hypothetical protein A2774_01185 [Candidatus Roizmanbacteria bacterium RIFCSPHIGHO2_01_FULL_39_12c]OGK46442.1 MAG: hypothetical protein A2963_01590 [Candidatus Roizmanbacteria bacterium RIFCSPLOWO2_01_FULL_40_13]